MDTDVTTETALHNELKSLLVRYHIPEHDAETLIQSIWPQLDELINFAEFIDHAQSDTSVEAIIEDPLAHLSDAEREGYIQERIAAMNPAVRDMLQQSSGKWAGDETSRK